MKNLQSQEILTKNGHTSQLIFFIIMWEKSNEKMRLNLSYKTQKYK